MLSLRYDFWQFGGSWAQRQVFNVTLIHAAVKANQHSLALALVAELKVMASSTLASVFFISSPLLSSPLPSPPLPSPPLPSPPLPSPPLPSPPLPSFCQAQKPKNKQLSKLFEQLKTVFDRRQKTLEPAEKKARLDFEK